MRNVGVMWEGSVGRLGVALERAGRWLFPVAPAGKVVRYPMDVGRSVWEPGSVLEVVFGDWPNQRLTGPVVGLESPEALLRAAELAAVTSRRPPTWRVWGMDVLVGMDAKQAGFGAAWVVALARRVAPGEVIWSDGGAGAERVMARLERAAARAGGVEVVAV